MHPFSWNVDGTTTRLVTLVRAGEFIEYMIVSAQMESCRSDGWGKLGLWMYTLVVSWFM